jgi:hypothetical protein
MTGNIVAPNGSSQGFVRDANGVYTTFSVPSYFYTTGRGIDDANNVVGYATNTFNLLNDEQFIRGPNGAITVIANQGVPLQGVAENQNAGGAIVGDYYNALPGDPSSRVGYVLSGGVLTDLAPAGATGVRARGIEDNGTVAGFASVGGLYQGFIDQGGSFSYYSDPNATAGNLGTYFENINNNGLVVGQWLDASSGSHAFVFDSVHGAFTDITVEGSSNTQAFALNDRGDVVVLANDLANGPNNFIYHVDAVPEPATWGLMLSGFGLVGAALRRRQTYRLVEFAAGGATSSETFRADDDQSALAQALEVAEGVAIEVWKDAALVARYSLTDAAAA